MKSKVSFISILILVAIVLYSITQIPVTSKEEQAYDKAITYIHEKHYYTAITALQRLDYSYEDVSDLITYCNAMLQYNDGEYETAKKTLHRLNRETIQTYGFEEFELLCTTLDAWSPEEENNTTYFTPTPAPSYHPTQTQNPSNSDDPYKASDYYNAEDFYDEYYDEFFDYDTAERYWYEHQDD